MDKSETLVTRWDGEGEGDDGRRQTERQEGGKDGKSTNDDDDPVGPAVHLRTNSRRCVAVFRRLSEAIWY
jgi:hypothetical protein